MKQESSKTHSPWMILVTVMVGTLLIGLDRTVVNLGVPKIISEFGITVTTAGWIATAYIISNAVFVPVFGKLGDMLGNRFIYLWSFVGFVIISLVAGLSWNIGSLIFFRAIQGLIGAAIYPTAMSLIAKTFRDKKDRAQALGIWSGSFAASAVIGPLVGGPLIDSFSWRMLFYINLPIGLLGILMVLLWLPEDRPMENKESFDYKGAVVLAIALSTLVLVLEKGQEWEWTSPRSFVSYLIVAVSGTVFYFLEKRTKNPLIDFNFFKNSVFVSALSVTFISFGAMMGSMFLIPIFAQVFLGYDATQTGYLFLPIALTIMVVSPLGARISSRVPPRWPVSIGMFISTAGFFLLSKLDPQTTGTDLIFPLMLFAAGLGLGMAPLTNAVASSVPPREVGIASGILNLTRNISGAVGIALFGTLLTNRINANVLEIGANTTINAFSPALQKIVPGLIVLKAQVAAYGFVFFVATFVMLAGAFSAFSLRESTKDYADETEKDLEPLPAEI